MAANVEAIENFTADLGSEHDPLWAEASLLVSTLACGESDPNIARVRFSGSVDVAWFDAPKLESGSDALIITKADSITGLPGDAFVVVDSAEVRPSDLATVVDLLASPPVLDLRGL